MKATRIVAELTADEITRLLALEPNATCGFVRVTYVAKQAIAAGGLPTPFAEGRPLGSALYFLVRPEARVRLLRVRNDRPWPTARSPQAAFREQVRG
jgi:predicted cupin superfamily sugar epimerase